MDLCSALQYLHLEKNVIHRDVKPHVGALSRSSRTKCWLTIFNQECLDFWFRSNFCEIVRLRAVKSMDWGDFAAGK